MQSGLWDLKTVTTMAKVQEAVVQGDTNRPGVEHSRLNKRDICASEVAFKNMTSNSNPFGLWNNQVTHI
jgi:hypothetical protein